MAHLLKFRSPGERAKRILNRRTGAVTDVVKRDLSNFYRKLLKVPLVPEGSYNPDDSGKNDQQRATILYNECITTLERDPSNFLELMHILNGYPLLDKEVEQMTQEGKAAEIVPQESDTLPLGGAQPRQKGLIARPAANYNDRNGREEIDAPNESLHEPVYPMRNKVHGQAVIINLVKTKYPIGSGESVSKFTKTFESLGYTVRPHGVISGSDLKSKLTEHVTVKDDSFICCIVAHGENGKVVAKDKERVELKDLQKVVGEDCPNLFGKPKIFIIQACRGGDVDKPLAAMEPEEEEEEALTVQLSREADFYIAYSTTEGHISTINENHGCPYLNTLCAVFDEEADKLTLDEMIMEVHHRLKGEVSSISDWPNKHIQMGQVTHTLRGPVRFKKFKQ